MRKLLIVFLVLGLGILAAPSVQSEAADLNFQYDILQNEFSFRGTVPPVYGEIPFAKEKWGGSGTSHFGLSGFNLGLRGPEITPFYLKLQGNFERDVTTNEYGFGGMEVGLGGYFDLFQTTNFGAEASVSHLNLRDIRENEFHIEAFVKWKFNFLEPAMNSTST